MNHFPIGAENRQQKRMGGVAVTSSVMMGLAKSNLNYFRIAGYPIQLQGKPRRARSRHAGSRDKKLIR